MDIQELEEYEGGFMGYYAKGHHDADEFLEEVADYIREFGSPEMPEPMKAENVRHEYWRNMPVDGGVVFNRAKGPGRGAYRVTVIE
jgi:hypothetical protein